MIWQTAPTTIKDKATPTPPIIAMLPLEEEQDTNLIKSRPTALSVATLLLETNLTNSCTMVLH
jgi:hypothetical protein